MLNGQKTIESRFSKNKIAPYEKITKDDIVLVKKSGGNIVAYFTIKEVLFFDLQDYAIKNIKAKYNKELCVEDTFWENKKDSHYATLIKIDKLVKLKHFQSIKKECKLGFCFKNGSYRPTYVIILLKVVDNYHFYRVFIKNKKLVKGCEVNDLKRTN